MKTTIYYLIIFVFFSGCGPSANNQVKKNIYNTEPRQESPQEIEAAMESVVSAISGQDISKKDLRDLSKEIRNDKEAQSAVQSIKDSILPSEVRVKYCPVCGKRYSPKFEKCSECHVILKDVSDE